MAKTLVKKSTIASGTWTQTNCEAESLGVYKCQVRGDRHLEGGTPTGWEESMKHQGFSCQER